MDTTVTLQGWCNSRRDHGGLIFIDLRDRYGITQVVFDPAINKETHQSAEHLSREDVISVSGVVRRRLDGMENPKLATGAIEVFVSGISVLSKADTPPIEIDDRAKINEDMRLKYRYLDLRRPALQQNIITRHTVTRIVREYFHAHHFIEIETPILAKSTPEGARDYLVPSRINPGMFYALPQSPQIFKQLLMVSGFDRYFQIAKCFRDEDLRADRQPEFTQIDVEMSFIAEEDMYVLVEHLLARIWKEIRGVTLTLPFPRMSYDTAVGTYGTDRPDTRFGLQLIDVSEIVKKSNFGVFTKAVASGGMVKCINATGCALFSRTDIENYTEFVAQYGAKGLAWMKVTEAGLESSIVKFFDERLQKEIITKTAAKQGDLLLFVADSSKIVHESLAALRLELGKRLKLIDTAMFNFLWVTDFPLLDYSEEEQKYIAMHHPFTSPQEQDLELLKTKPDKVKARAYDIVLNGTEIGGGSIRIHRRDVQSLLFSTLGISQAEAQEKFGFLLEAFKYGTPPHGGIALGLDRMCAILTGNDSIREVIAFPKNKAAESLLDGAPAEVADKQLDELHLKRAVAVSGVRNAVFEKIKDVFLKEKIDFEVLEHKAVYTSKEAAAARGTQLRQGCKALVLTADEVYIQAVVPGDRELDIKKLQKFTLYKTLELADAKQVKQVTDCNIGSVPPLGNLFGLKVYFDKYVLENEVVAFNAGAHTKSIKVKAKDLQRVVNPVVGDFSL